MHEFVCRQMGLKKEDMALAFRIIGEIAIALFFQGSGRPMLPVFHQNVVDLSNIFLFARPVNVPKLPVLGITIAEPSISWSPQS